MSISERLVALAENQEFLDWLKYRYGYTIEYVLRQYNETVITSQSALKVVRDLCEAGSIEELDTVELCTVRFLEIETAFKIHRGDLK